MMVAELTLDFGLEREEKVKMDASIGWGKDPMVWWHVYDLLSIGTPLAPECNL